MVKKSSVIWVCMLLIVAVFAVYLVISGQNEKKKNEELPLLMTQSYVIGGVKYPSYSQLKYIALNELSQEEVKDFMVICGINQTEANLNSSDYKGDCGRFNLQILNRSNSKNFIRYTYFFHTNNREYLKMLKSEVMQEKNNKINDSEIKGYIDDYWYVGVNKDIYEGGFTIFFQRWQSKKLNSQ